MFDIDNKRYIKLIIVILFLTALLYVLVSYFPKWSQSKVVNSAQPSEQEQQNAIKKTTDVPLSINNMRNRDYPGSDLKIEQTLTDGSNYKQYIVSYLSDGLKINALLTVPKGPKPEHGWPVIIFNHGYIPPEIYKTTERYVSYVDYFAKNGYIVLKPDYRGNGSSEGQPEGAYYSPAYTTDVLNAVSSIKKNPQADPAKIGMWGHSMGGNITLRSIVVDTKDIRAAVIWGGVVGTYNDLIHNWDRKVPFTPSARELAQRNNGRAHLISTYGDPVANPDFWNSIDPNAYVSDIQTPIQLHTGLSDEEVPWKFSQGLYERLMEANKNAEIYSYLGGDHNLSGTAFNTAMARSLQFFDSYLK